MKKEKHWGYRILLLCLILLLLLGLALVFLGPRGGVGMLYLSGGESI